MTDRVQGTRGGGRERVAAYALAVLCFFALGFVVYRDDAGGTEQTRGAFARLSERGREGYRLWREQNCHTCHQLYGFGGYLGPDLTHVTRRVKQADFELILLVGVGAMPRADVTGDGLKALFTFLSEMDRSGQGHVRLQGELAGEDGPTWEQVFAALKSGKGAEAAAAGIAVFEELNCRDCHRPLRLGRLASPDLTRAHEKIGVEGIKDCLRRGRGNMPLFPLLDADGGKKMEAVVALLRELGRERAELKAKLVKTEAGGRLPWWNFDEAAAGREGKKP